ncbi:MAG: hypothetical protein AAF570_00370 [Bacteroidota bacterium]
MQQEPRKKLSEMEPPETDDPGVGLACLIPIAALIAGVLVLYYLLRDVFDGILGSH